MRPLQKKQSWVPLPFSLAAYVNLNTLLQGVPKSCMDKATETKCCRRKGDFRPGNQALDGQDGSQVLLV